MSDCFTGQTLSSLQGHAGNLMAVFAGDQAHLLCSGSADKSVRLWDLRMARSIDVIATSSCVTSVCFNYGTTHSLMLASGRCNVQFQDQLFKSRLGKHLNFSSRFQLTITVNV